MELHITWPWGLGELAQSHSSNNTVYYYLVDLPILMLAFAIPTVLMLKVLRSHLSMSVYSREL